MARTDNDSWDIHDERYITMHKRRSVNVIGKPFFCLFHQATMESTMNG